MMTALIVEPVSITLPLLGNKVSEADIRSDVKLAKALQASLAALVQAIKELEN